MILVTMSTVGYGDVTPKTPGGKLAVAVLTVVAALYIAMPISIVGSAFSQVRARCRQLRLALGGSPYLLHQVAQWRARRARSGGRRARPGRESASKRVCARSRSLARALLMHPSAGGRARPRARGARKVGALARRAGAARVGWRTQCNARERARAGAHAHAPSDGQPTHAWAGGRPHVRVARRRRAHAGGRTGARSLGARAAGA